MFDSPLDKQWLAKQEIAKADGSGSIGVFDSGVGGLSVARHVFREMPGERMLYIADNAFAPYGCKTQEEIERRSVKISSYLIQSGVKALVVACNTATAAAIARLRTLFDLPIIGMEPALKPAAEQTRTGVIGVLATTGTLNSEKFDRLQTRFGSRVRVISQACPGLVELIEEGRVNCEETRELLQAYLRNLLDKGADTVVLGCTHYPFVIPLIRQICGPDVYIVDTGIPVTREIGRRLDCCGLLAPPLQRGGIKVLSTGNSNTVRPVVSALWGKSLDVGDLDCFSLEI